MRFEGKTALITGAGSGIGAATAKIIASEGGSAAIVGIPGDLVASVASEITAGGGRAIAIDADVSISDDVERAVATTVGEFGGLDILVSNAGVQLHDRDVAIHELPESVWDETMAVNLKGMYLTCKFGLRQMLDQGSGGAVVITSSITAINARVPNFAYTTSKGALLALSRNIALTYAEHGIRCNAVLPGALERTPNHDIHPSPVERERRLREIVPLGRVGLPEEIASMIAFLASDEASYATAAEFVVDGGRTRV
jgi:NAD(P)-dependent dehydrogenase (short-subunit alcohol dehydrogenase family)